jgi:hypothetical protein
MVKGERGEQGSRTASITVVEPVLVPMSQAERAAAVSAFKVAEALAERAKGGENRQALLDEILTIVLAPGIGDEQIGNLLRTRIGIEQVFADLIDGPLAHLPSGGFAANSAWLACAGIAPNLTRTAGHLAGSGYQAARAATIRTRIINVAARLAHRARTIHLHLSERWPWQYAWGTTCSPPYTLHPAEPSTSDGYRRPAQATPTPTTATPTRAGRRSVIGGSALPPHFILTPATPSNDRHESNPWIEADRLTGNGLTAEPAGSAVRPLPVSRSVQWSHARLGVWQEFGGIVSLLGSAVLEPEDQYGLVEDFRQGEADLPYVAGVRGTRELQVGV